MDNTANVAVPPSEVVESIDSIGDVRHHIVAGRIDALLMRSFFKLLKNDSTTALSQLLPFRLTLGSR